jgi:hypothetical protein
MALHATWKIRLAMELLELVWSETDVLPDEIKVSEAVRAAMGVIRDWLKNVEEGQLRDAQLTTRYCVVRPISPAFLKSSAEMTEIRQAMTVLNKHALIITDDDC